MKCRICDSDDSNLLANLLWGITFQDLLISTIKIGLSQDEKKDMKINSSLKQIQNHSR